MVTPPKPLPGPAQSSSSRSPLSNSNSNSLLRPHADPCLNSLLPLISWLPKRNQRRCRCPTSQRTPGTQSSIQSVNPSRTSLRTSPVLFLCPNLNRPPMKLTSARISSSPIRLRLPPLVRVHRCRLFPRTRSLFLLLFQEVQSRPFPTRPARLEEVLPNRSIVLRRAEARSTVIITMPRHRSTLDLAIVVTKKAHLVQEEEVVVVSKADRRGSNSHKPSSQSLLLVLGMFSLTFPPSLPVETDKIIITKDLNHRRSYLTYPNNSMKFKLAILSNLPRSLS